MVIPAENKNLPTNDQRGEKFIKLCYNLVPHAFLGDAKSYVGKDRYRIKVKKYLSFGNRDFVVASFQSACVNRAFGGGCQTVDSLFLQLGEWCPNGCPLSSARRQS